MDREAAIKLLCAGEVETFNRTRPRERFDLSGAGITRFEDLSGVDLSNANLVECRFQGSELSRANFAGSNMAGANLNVANIENANFSKTQLVVAHVEFGNASSTTFHETDLRLSTLRFSVSKDADFKRAQFGRTVIAGVLKDAIGLDQSFHAQPSEIAVQTVLGMGPDLPEQFLRGCGLQDEEIAYFRSRVGAPIRFYSCFISYSADDEGFASRLHADFQAEGIRCWKWDHDARTGQSLWGEIDQAIRMYDKLVLIASASSLKSPAVNREIERAIQQEDERLKKRAAGKYDGDVNALFPVRLDNYIFDSWEHERKADVTKKVIADARGWDKNEAKYREVRDRLIRDLKAGAARDAERRGGSGTGVT